MGVMPSTRDSSHLPTATLSRRRCLMVGAAATLSACAGMRHGAADRVEDLAAGRRMEVAELLKAAATGELDTDAGVARQVARRVPAWVIGFPDLVQVGYVTILSAAVNDGGRQFPVKSYYCPSRRSGGSADLSESVQVYPGDATPPPTFTASGTAQAVTATGALTMSGAALGCAINFEDSGSEPFLVSAWYRGQSGNSDGAAAALGLSGRFPTASSLLLGTGVAVPNDSFFERTAFKGAFGGVMTDWTQGWTVYGTLD